MTLRYKYRELFRKGELQRRRLYRMLQDLDGRPGGSETDPVFTAHVAHSITQADIDRWNSGTGTESDPVFTASPAHNITADDVTALKTGYEARIASLETQLSALQTTVTRLDTTLSTSIQNEG